MYNSFPLARTPPFDWRRVKLSKPCLFMAQKLVSFLRERIGFLPYWLVPPPGFPNPAQPHDTACPPFFGHFDSQRERYSFFGHGSSFFFFFRRVRSLPSPLRDADIGSWRLFWHGRAQPFASNRGGNARSVGAAQNFPFTLCPSFSEWRSKTRFFFLHTPSSFH